VAIPDSEKVSTQCTNATDTQPDRQTPGCLQTVTAAYRPRLGPMYSYSIVRQNAQPGSSCVRRIWRKFSVFYSNRMLCRVLAHLSK